jgi:hypothetical protein
MIRFIKHKWARRQERFYRKNRWHLVLDITLVIIIILLIATAITLYFYRPSTSNIINQPLPERLELDLNNPPLAFDFSVASSSFNLAEGAELKINLHNSSRIVASDIKVNLLPLDEDFSISKLEFADTNNETDKEEINNKQLTIDSLGANESKEIKVKVYFKNNNSAVRTIKWQAQEEYSIKGQIVKGSVALPDLYLNAELKAQAVIYYNSPQGDELGSGPLPPLVGLPTNYWAFFEVKSAGEFKNLVFSAKLPKGVELTDKRSLLAGDFTYSTSSRQVIWKIPELKNQDDSYRVGFEIQFIPEDKQVDKTAILLGSLKCYAHDVLTNNDSYIELADLSTNLDFDRINKGAGKISRP